MAAVIYAVWLGGVFTVAISLYYTLRAVKLI